MNIATIIVVFSICWWVVFFMALPVGVKRDDNPKAGNDSGAPNNANVGKKAIITTLIATSLTLFYFLILPYFI